MALAEIGLRLVAGVVLILANGFFVAIEFALTRARQFTESEFLDGDARLERAWEMTQELEVYLTTCQVGITASSIAVGIVAEPALAELFEPLFAGTRVASIGLGAFLAFLLINLVHLTHGEQTPTYLGVERSRMVCRYGAGPLYWFHRAISPIITLGDWVAKRTLGLFGIEMTGAWLESDPGVRESRAQLRARLDSLLEEGELPAERRTEVLNALDVDELSLEEIMVPAADVIALSTTDTFAENLDRIRGSPHVRFPLVEDDLAEFRGIVYLPSVVDNFEALQSGESTLTDVAAPPMTLSATTTVDTAYDRFQAADQELALVIRDETVVGLVTATDALECVMGELEDPLDRMDAQ
jgi:CBS domain containing-hemolysin-like protein